MKPMVLVAVAILTIGAVNPPPPVPNWLAGAWVEVKGEGWTEEFWSPMRGGLMMGAGRSGQADQLLSWEVMRLERVRDGSFIFWGAPRGGKAAPFPSTAVTATSIVFAEPAHDYPERIRYWRDGKLLHAEIAKADGTRAMRWTFKPAGMR